MNAAEELAVIRALQTGLREAADQAESKVMRVRQETGGKTFETPLGRVTVTVRKPSVAVDDAELLAYVEANYPDEVEVVRMVRSSFRSALVAGLMVSGDEVVDSNGVVVEYATVRPGGESVTVVLTPEVKQSAAAQVAAGMDRLLGVMAIGGPEPAIPPY